MTVGQIHRNERIRLINETTDEINRRLEDDWEYRHSIPALIKDLELIRVVRKGGFRSDPYVDILHKKYFPVTQSIVESDKDRFSLIQYCSFNVIFEEFNRGVSIARDSWKGKRKCIKNKINSKFSSGANLIVSFKNKSDKVVSWHPSHEDVMAKDWFVV